MRPSGLRLFAAALAVVAVVLVVRQLGIFGYRPLGSPRERPPGPPIVGARGRLAYVRDGDLYVMDLRDGLERRLTRTGGIRAPRWSGSGSWISFERDSKLSVIQADATGIAELPGGDVPAGRAWSPQGARLAYSSSDGSLNTFDPGARGSPRRTIVPAGSGVGPGLAWAADANRIAYERHQTAGPGGVSNESIWTVTELGRDPLPVLLASGDVRLTVCCWTYNGTFILFWQGPSAASAAGDGVPLMLGTPLSSQPVQIVEAAPVTRSFIDTAARSDGFAFVAGAPAARRLVIGQPRTIAGNRLAVDTAVVESAPAVASPAWAPIAGAAQLLAYSSGGRIWLARAQGTERHPLLADATVPAAVVDERPMWALDGKTLLFARRLSPQSAPRPGGTPDALEIWVASADGATSHRVVSGLADPGQGPNGAVDLSSVFDYHSG